MQRVDRCIAMHPQHIKASQPAKNPIVQGACHRHRRLVSQHGQKFMPIPVQQWHVPLHAHAESFILVVPHGKVRTEKHGQIDVRLLCDPPQQRSLILDGMADQVGEPDFISHTMTCSSAPRSHVAAILSRSWTPFGWRCCRDQGWTENRAVEAIPSTVAIPPPLIAAFIALVGRKTISSVCNTGSGALPLKIFLISTVTTLRSRPTVRMMRRSSALPSHPGPPPIAAACIRVSGEFCCSGIGPWVLNAPSR